jgi:hypothetical protein
LVVGLVLTLACGPPAVLNRSMPEVETEKKTASGKTFKKKD